MGGAYMSVLIPDDITIDNLEELNKYYGDTLITFNGQYYDHTREIYLRKDGGDYVLATKVDAHRRVYANKILTGLHHYMVDSTYKFIQSFVTINNQFVCTLSEKSLMTVYIARSFCFFKSLPPTIRSTLKENGRNIFIDYTQMIG